MWNKISEGVVQGILIAAIGFSAATVWNLFQSSTEDLRIAKSQLSAQIERNQQLIEFNKNQRKINQDLLEISKRQSLDIEKLTTTILSLKETLGKVTAQSSVKLDESVSQKLSEIKSSSEWHNNKSVSVLEQQQQQQVIYGQMQQQQEQQQQIQKSWY